MTTAEKLVRLRKEKGLSQLQLAEEINVSRQAISRWEVGLAVPSREKLKALSELYHVSMDYLLSDLSDKEAEDVQKVSEPEDEAKEKSSNHLRVGLIACVVVILLIVVGAMLLHLHNTHEPQNEVPISEMETEEDDVVFSGDFSVDW